MSTGAKVVAGGVGVLIIFSMGHYAGEKDAAARSGAYAATPSTPTPSTAPSMAAPSTTPSASVVVVRASSACVDAAERGAAALALARRATAAADRAAYDYAYARTDQAIHETWVVDDLRPQLAREADGLQAALARCKTAPTG